MIEFKPAVQPKSVKVEAPVAKPEPTAPIEVEAAPPLVLTAPAEEKKARLSKAAATRRKPATPANDALRLDL